MNLLPPSSTWLPSLKAILVRVYGEREQYASWRRKTNAPDNGVGMIF